jgi:hypothetical protein
LLTPGLHPDAGSGLLHAAWQCFAKGPSIATDFKVVTPRSLFMTSILLALVPLLFVLGFLAWAMSMGAREQERSDAWAESWVAQQQAKKKLH